MSRELPHIDYDLIAKCLSGEGDEMDHEMLENWLQASEENAAEYESLKKIWSATDEPATVVDVDAAWKKVETSVDEAPVISIHKNESQSRKWLSRAAAVAVLLAAGIGLWFNQGMKPEMLVLESGNATAEVQLPDGSHVTLREHSSLQYPAAFEGVQREVTLTGVGYFSVTGNKEHPFVVHTEAADVLVVGTEFEVDARAPQQQVVVEVAEGVVEVSNSTSHLSSTVEAGRVCTLNVAEASIGVEEISDPGSFFWKDRTIRFRRTELGRVAKTLEDLMGIHVRFSSEAISGCELTATFRDEDPQTIMEIIATTLGLGLTYEGTTFILSGEGC